MAIYELDGQAPELPADGRCWIADSAAVIGRVRFHSDTSVWFGAVLRGDNEWIEVGTRSQIQDNATLHTDPGCTQPPAGRSMTGNINGLDCDVNANGNQGCGVNAPGANSYGPSFNQNGGGWYAMERTNSFIRVFFWPRNAGSVPSDVSSGASTINTDNWVRILPHNVCYGD